MKLWLTNFLHRVCMVFWSWESSLFLLDCAYQWGRHSGFLVASCTSALPPPAKHSTIKHSNTTTWTCIRHLVKEPNAQCFILSCGKQRILCIININLYLLFTKTNTFYVCNYSHIFVIKKHTDNIQLVLKVNITINIQINVCQYSCVCVCVYLYICRYMCASVGVSRRTISSVIWSV